MTLSIDNSQHMFELKYRPQTLDECILPAADKETFKAILSKGKIPHLILQSNSPGTGKTTLAKVLPAELGVTPLFVNGADCRIDFIRNELTSYASSVGLDGKQKIIIIDEFDRAGLGDAQRHLRTFMEAYGDNCSIIITANNLDGIITPLQSRARVIKFGTPDAEDRKNMMREMLARIIAICKNENIEVSNRKVLTELIKRNFPDFRKTVNQLDFVSSRGIVDDEILKIVVQDRGSIEHVIEAIKTPNIKVLKQSAARFANEYPQFIEQLAADLYERLDNESIVTMYEIIGENNQYHGIAASTDVHLTYLLVQLAVTELGWK